MNERAINVTQVSMADLGRPCNVLRIVCTIERLAGYSFITLGPGGHRWLDRASFIIDP